MLTPQIIHFGRELMINGAELVRLWDQMCLTPWIRSAWRPLTDSAGTAA